MMQERSKKIYDVCVIGTGAGGGVMIDRLTAAGMSVVALERGPQFSPADFDEDELKTILRRKLFSPDKVETCRSDANETAENGNFAEIIHGVGGSVTHWGAWAWRYRADEFRVLSREGQVAGATLADWPIGYNDLEPYYEVAEADFGVAGRSGSNPFEARRRNAYPNPPHPWRPSSHLFASGSKKLGYTPFPLPLAINSQAYGNRPACINGGACRGHGCPIFAKASALSVSLPRAFGTGNFDLRADATVYELPVGNDGRLTGARYLDAYGKPREVKARQVIVAAGALGTAQLLLMSKSGQFPYGLANGSGQVGRNLTYHHFPIVAATFDEDLRTYTGVESLVAVDDLHPSDAKRGFIRGGVVAESNVASNQPLMFGALLQSLTPGARWGAGFKEKLREFPKTMLFSGICEELPHADTRVDLDPKLEDARGLPVPRITKRQHDNDIVMHAYFKDKLYELAEASGASKVHHIDVPNATVTETTSQKGSTHNHGTCRMGDDAETSVVDKWCRSHEVANLWITDGSVFPTAGGYNPTLTILANAYRVADHFIDEARRLSL